jgi:hypothetical protein
MKILSKTKFFAASMAALMTSSAAFANTYDGIYSSSFSFQMSKDSLCPKPLPIHIKITIKNSSVVGSIRNNGGGNENSFCALYHNGSINGDIDANGDLNVSITQEDAHSAQYSSYALTGNIAGPIALISKSKKFHPTVKFQISRSGAAPSTEGTMANSSIEQAEAGYEIGRKAFIALSEEQRILVQTSLQKLTLYSGGIDGRWGRGTYAAIKAYLAGKAETENNFVIVYTELSQDPTTLIAEEVYDSGELPSDGASLTKKTAHPLSTPEEAKLFVADVEAFVAMGNADFDIEFAKKYAEVLGIKSGEWDEEMQERLSDFQTYVFASDAFRNYRAAVELERTTELRAEAEELKEKIATGSIELSDWVRKNLLDPQSASVVEAVEAAQSAAGTDDIELLRNVAAQIELTKAKAGILKTDDLPETPGSSATLDGYTTDAIYVLGNFSGKGEHIYRGLSGRPEFDAGNVIACLQSTLDQWEKYTLSNVLVAEFTAQNIQIKASDCRGTEDILVAKGVELNRQNFPSNFANDTLQEILVIQQNAVFDEKSKLEIASELYEADIMNGSKIGHGLVIFNDSTAALCLVVDGNKDDHIIALEGNKKILSTFVEFTEGYSLAIDAIDAFKRIQRNECGSIYASAETLSKLIEAAQNNQLNYLVAPAWVTPSTLEEIALQRESSEKAEAAEREAKEQNAALREQATESARKKAVVLQEELQSRNNVRFSALVDGLSSTLRIAVEFGLLNSPLDKGYTEQYSLLPFLDPVDPSQSPFDSIIGEVQSLALEKWEMTGFIVEKVDYGDVSYNGRTLEGIVTELKVSLKNRVVGDFGTYCRVVRAVKDDDFDMMRQISIDECGSNHDAWKVANAFSSKWLVDPTE